VDVFERNVSPGDIFLLCSDGLYDMLDDEEIRCVMIEMGAHLDQGWKNCCDEHLKRGVDNVTLILARVVAS